MTQPIALLAGGTKILERALQTTLPVELAVVGTIEEAAKIMGERPVGLVVLGPTLRRALAMVATLRREGQTWPRLLVVYRDDQRDEVKRHQRGKVVADGYVALSRIAKELGPVATEQWQAAALPGAAAGAQPSGSVLPRAAGMPGRTADEEDEGLEEIPVESIELQDVISQEMDVLPPMQGGADRAAADRLQASADHVVPNQANARLSNSLPVETTMEVDAIEIFEEAAIEEASLEELPAAAVADAGEELIEDEIVAEELIEEIPSDELISENVTHAAVAAVHAVDAALADDMLDADDVEEIGADDVMMDDAPVAAAEATPAAEPASTREPVPVSLPTAAAAPAESRASRPQSGAFAALGDLSGFIERLQEASNHVDRLEAENDALRHDVESLARSVRPEMEAEIKQAQARVHELAVRLDGAERARDVAVEARMRAEQRELAQQAELAHLRAEVEAGRNRETGLEAQLDAKARIAQDAARSLRGLSQLLDS
ncbi:MAG: hypothetical protein EXR79_07750 [Myxococcales bacterium]|nr:hypothetical protein [Myxococcales bacterium]